MRATRRPRTQLPTSPRPHASPLTARAAHLASAAPYTHGGSARHALSGSRKKDREPTENERAPRSIGDEGGVHERSAEELAPAESCSVRLSNDSDFYYRA